MNDCSPIMKSPAVLHTFQFQESPSSPIEHRYCYQERSLRPWILPAIDKEDSTMFTQESAVDFKSTNITYQTQRFSITFVVPGIGRFDEDRNESMDDQDNYKAAS